MSKKKKKPLTKAEIKAERDEFQWRLERIYLWNEQALTPHSQYLAAELKRLVLDEERILTGFH